MRNYQRNLKIPEPWTGVDPYQAIKEAAESGIDHRKLEMQADAANLDRDFTNGVDDGTGVWNMPNQG